MNRFAAAIRPFLCLLAILLVVGCSSGRDTNKDPIPPPWPEAGAPERLMILAEDLQVYLAETGRLPSKLTIMDDVHLAVGGPYDQTRFNYHPAGLAFLRDGWRLIAIDDRRAEPGKVWCLVRPAVRVMSAPRFRVVLISVAELRESAVAP